MAVCAAIGFQASRAVDAQAVASVGAPRTVRTETTALAALLDRVVTVDVDRVSVSQALAALAERSHVQIVYERPLVDASAKRVTVHVNKTPLGTVLSDVLAGTGMKIALLPGIGLGIVKSTGDGKTQETGGIIGTVANAVTKQPMVGVAVMLDDAVQQVVTQSDGTYRLSAVTPGEHRVTIKLLGFVKQTRTVRVQDGQLVTLDVMLAKSANVLEQVVVTGTVIPTERKAIPNAMTVITAKDIEQRGITQLNELFRGDVPGMFVLNSGSSLPFGTGAMFSRGATALSDNSVGTTTIDNRATNTNTIKTYVDGVELAQSSDLFLIDPKSVERIEILTGPQASTIYGSNAINGVMQIFTKRGSSSTPQLTLNLLSGWVQNNLSRAFAPRHNDNVQLNGMEGRLSYYGNGSWNYTGSWTPGVHVTERTGSAGVRLELPTVAGRVTTDLSLRRTLAQNLYLGASDQTTTNYREQGFYRNTTAANGVTTPSTGKVTGQTMGLTLTYQPTTWWSHEAMTGQDISNDETFTTGKGYSDVSDSTLSAYLTYFERRSLRYTTTVRAPITTLANATLIAGADAWQTTGYSWSGQSTTTLFTALSSPEITRSRDHNTGAFLQGQLNVVEHLFFTYGVRAEYNKAIGDKAKFLPGRYGVAYSQEFGSLTAKVRGSYGRSIRPPYPYYQNGVLAMSYSDPPFPQLVTAYGKDLYTQLPNPEIVPEYQQGGEGGLELYLGSRGSLIITRYNQTVDGLIDYVTVADSTRSLSPYALLDGSQTCAQIIALYAASRASTNPYCSSQDADGYAYYPQSEYLNIGSIRNQGWELQGTVNLGPFSTHGTYSWVKSRVIGITPKFRAFFTPQAYPQYQPGAPFHYLPEHTWAWGGSYTNATTTAGLNVNGVGQIVSSSNDFVLEHLNPTIRLPQNRMNFAPKSYISVNHGYALADMILSHRVATRLEGTVQVQNLLDKYQNDVSAIYPTAGRQTSVGLRVHF